MMLVSLQQAKDHLRMDHDDDDNDITLKVHAASGAVVNYVKSDNIYQYAEDSEGEIVTDSSGDPVVLLDSSGDPVPKFEVQAAVLIMLGELYMNREAELQGEVAAQWGYGYLPQPVIALLYPLRDPALA